MSPSLLSIRSSIRTLTTSLSLSRSRLSITTTHPHPHPHPHTIPTVCTRALSTKTIFSSPRPALSSRVVRFPWSARPAVQESRVVVGEACGVVVGQQIRGMKTRSSVKRLCDGCKPVKRKGRVFVICSKNPKHKQRQGK